MYFCDLKLGIMKKYVTLIVWFVFCLFAFIRCEENLIGKRLSGKLISNTDCKTSLKSNYPDTLSCMEYAWDASDNTLSLTHINAGFNCCPESLYCKISLSNDTIYIQEFEKKALCDCNCLYDLSIEINDITAKTYILHVIEPYAEGLDPLCFTINLNANKSGLYSVVRKQYPWGLSSVY
jgi:hypothetical protein